MQDPPVNTEVRYTFQPSTQHKQGFFGLLGLVSVFLVSSAVQGQVDGVVFEAAVLLLLLFGAVTAKRMMTELTPTGIRIRKGISVEGVPWQDITDVTVAGRKSRQVRLATKGRDIKLALPLGTDPDFETKVEQIRAAWLAAKGTSLPLR